MRYISERRNLRYSHPEVAADTPLWRNLAPQQYVKSKNVFFSSSPVNIDKSRSVRRYLVSDCRVKQILSGEKEGKTRVIFGKKRVLFLQAFLLERSHAIEEISLLLHRHDECA